MCDIIPVCDRLMDMRTSLLLTIFAVAILTASADTNADNIDEFFQPMDSDGAKQSGSDVLVDLIQMNSNHFHDEPENDEDQAASVDDSNKPDERKNKQPAESDRVAELQEDNKVNSAAELANQLSEHESAKQTEAQTNHQKQHSNGGSKLGAQMAQLASQEAKLEGMIKAEAGETSMFFMIGIIAVVVCAALSAAVALIAIRSRHQRDFEDQRAKHTYRSDENATRSTWFSGLWEQQQLEPEDQKEKRSIVDAQPALAPAQKRDERRKKLQALFNRYSKNGLMTFQHVSQFWELQAEVGFEDGEEPEVTVEMWEELAEDFHFNKAKGMEFSHFALMLEEDQSIDALYAKAFPNGH